jgi:hypothetical protein
LEIAISIPDLPRYHVNLQHTVNGLHQTRPSVLSTDSLLNQFFRIILVTLFKKHLYYFKDPFKVKHLLHEILGKLGNDLILDHIHPIKFKRIHKFLKNRVKASIYLYTTLNGV